MIAFALLVAAGALAGLTWLLWLRGQHLVVVVRGPSMVPTYRHGDRVLVRRCAGERLRTGQVVVVDLPPHIRPVPAGLSPEQALRQRRVIKRVAAVAGEPVPSAVRSVDRTVPPSCLVLLGDNPDGSGDSRQYGYVPTDAVVGRVLRRLRGGAHVDPARDAPATRPAREVDPTPKLP